jgi:DNA-binding MarR family transcriptional regulator
VYFISYINNWPIDKHNIGVYTPNMENETQQPDALALAEIEATCLCLNVRKMARALTHSYEGFLQPGGLRITQFNLLVAIALAQKVPLTRLAEVLAMDRTTLARNLKPLESQNLATVETSTEDRRVRVIALTEHGRQLLTDALPRWRQAQTYMTSLLGQQQSQALLADSQAVMELVPFSV